MALSLTQRWLSDAAQPYPSRARVYADADAALARFPTLRPKADVYSTRLSDNAGPTDACLPSFR